MSSDKVEVEITIAGQTSKRRLSIVKFMPPSELPSNPKIKKSKKPKPEKPPKPDKPPK